MAAGPYPPIFSSDCVWTGTYASADPIDIRAAAGIRWGKLVAGYEICSPGFDYAEAAKHLARPPAGTPYSFDVLRGTTWADDAYSPVLGVGGFAGFYVSRVDTLAPLLVVCAQQPEVAATFRAIILESARQRVPWGSFFRRNIGTLAKLYEISHRATNRIAGELAAVANVSICISEKRTRGDAPVLVARPLFCFPVDLAIIGADSYTITHNSLLATPPVLFNRDLSSIVLNDVVQSTKRLAGVSVSARMAAFVSRYASLGVRTYDAAAVFGGPSAGA